MLSNTLLVMLSSAGVPIGAGTAMKALSKPRAAALAILMIALTWAAVWWVPEPFGSMTGKQYRAKSAEWKHRQSEACRLSSSTISHLADGANVRLPDADCGWSRGDLALAQQAPRAFRSQVAKDFELYNAWVGVPPRPAADKPRYSPFRTRASVYLHWVGKGWEGGALCYFFRTPGGWRSQHCSIYVS